MEYSPPPLFKQGASARAKVVFFSVMSVVMLLVDSRMHTLATARQVIGTVLYPLQMVALMPRDSLYKVGEYFTSQSTLEKENKNLKQQQIIQSQAMQQTLQLFAENEHLRKLLGTAARIQAKSVMSEILYDARDAFTRKIVLDRGTQHGVALGQPVIDDIGVVGQVTRVFLLTSEVTLLTDKDQAIPVQVVRSGLRSVAYGRGQSGVLDLRFMATNADIQKGDLLTTTGIDGVYPPGLSVAKVVHVENKSSDAFARIVCQPLAGIDRNRQLLILLTDPKATPRPPPEVEDKKNKSGKRTGREAAKDGVKEAAKESAKDVVKMPAKDAPPVPANGVTKVPVKEPVKDAAKMPLKDAATAPVKDVAKVVPAKDAVKVPAKVETQEPAREAAKIDPKSAVKIAPNDKKVTP